MKIHSLSLFLLLTTVCCGQKQTYPIPLDTARSHETIALAEAVKEETNLNLPVSSWHVVGMGDVRQHEDGIDILYPSQPEGVRPAGSPDDPDYATYGECRAICEFPDEDWSGYDRMLLDIYPDAPGMKVTGLNLAISGQHDGHLLNLTEGRWNKCYLDLGLIDASNVSRIVLYSTIKGKDRTAPDTVHFYVKNLRLQKLEKAVKQVGWEPDENTIIYPTDGYLASYQKTAIISGSESSDTFTLESPSGEVVYQGSVKKDSTSIGLYGVLDFSSFNKPGEYILRAGNIVTKPFSIADNLWDRSSDLLLSFIHSQRCGDDIPGVHSSCHHDLYAVHDGKKICYAGGWHDAGDLSQQTIQTADVAYNLLEGYQAVKNTDSDLSKRMLGEAKWGFDFVLSSRFGDGWHASSMGLLHWTDDTPGTFDDITTVRTQDNALDNFLYAGYEAYASRVFPDKAYSEKLLEAAKEDYEFAVKKFQEDGFDHFKFQYEHIYNTSHSQFMATASWAASQLFVTTSSEKYADDAAEYMNYVLDCQQIEPIAGKYFGFFYRDKDKTSIVHFIHQSRDQIYAQALVALCESQSDHEMATRWRASLESYASYLKSLMAYTAPYGMIPSGIYSLDETSDVEGFNSLHIFSSASDMERYAVQVRMGEQVDETHYIKRFPVWFNIFSGNNAVILSIGKAAAICGNYLSDDSLLEIAAEQLYWITGKNPFGQSMIYGAGYNYPSMSSFSSGELMGEIAVGIKTYGDEDVPCWPSINCSCYKEVWTPCAGKAISLMSEIYRNVNKSN